MAEKRFPYEKSRWCAGDEESRRWRDVLEGMSPEYLRKLLAENPAGSAASVWIGGVSMTKGFAEYYLDWNDRQETKRKNRFWRAEKIWVPLLGAPLVAAFAAAVINRETLTAWWGALMALFK